MLLTVDEPVTLEQLKAENVTLRAELARLSTLEAARAEHELVFGCIRRLLERAFTTDNKGEK